MAALVRIQDLSKSYDQAGQQRLVLRELRAEFASGEYSAIRGRSGSGKSTLLNLIAGIDEPSAGHIAIGNDVVSEMSARERAHYRRENIGFVFQFFHLIPTLSVLENTSLPAELAGFSEAEAQAKAARLIEQVGLGGRENDFPDKLSGGEQQRVAIARALIQDPKLVLADEPTGNLDRLTGERVLGLLQELVQERGLTLILATHSHRIAAAADQRWALIDGQLETDTETLN